MTFNDRFEKTTRTNVFISDLGKYSPRLSCQSNPAEMSVRLRNLAKVLKDTARDDGLMSLWILGAKQEQVALDLLDKCMVPIDLKKQCETSWRQNKKLLSKLSEGMRISDGALASHVKSWPRAQRLRALNLILALKGEQPASEMAMWWAHMNVGCLHKKMVGHLVRLGDLLDRAGCQIKNAPPDFIAKLNDKQHWVSLPKPWPVVATLLQRLGGRVVFSGNRKGLAMLSEPSAAWAMPKGNCFFSKHVSEKGSHHYRAMMQKDLKTFYQQRQNKDVVYGELLVPLDFKVLNALEDSGLEPSKELVQTLRRTLCEFFRLEFNEDEDWVPTFVQRAVKRVAVPMLYAL